MQVKLYIFDKTAGDADPTTGKLKGSWTEKYVSFGQLLDEAQVTRALSSLSDSAIDDILKKK